MIIHQIFISLKEGATLSKGHKNAKVYEKSHKLWIEFCKKHNYTYMLWDGDSIDELLAEEGLPTKFYFPNGSEMKFGKIDFARYVFLNKFGGLYVDLDIYPKERFNDILKRPILINKWRKTYFNKDGSIKKYGKYEIQNGLMKFPKGFTKDLIQYSLHEYRRITKIPIYKIWVQRFFFQSVGNPMFKRWCSNCKKVRETGLAPPKKLTYDDDILNYIVDVNTKAWGEEEIYDNSI